MLPDRQQFSLSKKCNIYTPFVYCKIMRVKYAFDARTRQLGRSKRPLSGGRKKTGVQISVELFVLPLQEGVIVLTLFDLPHLTTPPRRR
ncbi:hypothetical protein ACI65C_010014 [Semiaphis heraclei]